MYSAVFEVGMETHELKNSSNIEKNIIQLKRNEGEIF